MNKKTTYFRLFSCCILVKGASRGLVCDTQRASIMFIDNEMIDFLINIENYSVEDIKYHFDHQDDEKIDTFFQYLTQNELGFFTKTPELFPKLNLEWMNPSIITNAIIDVGSIKFNYKELITQLDTFGCVALQIRFYSAVSWVDLNELLSYTQNSQIKTIELLLQFDGSEDFDKNLQKLIDFIQRLTLVHVFSGKEKKSYNYRTSKVVYDITNLISNKGCGIIVKEDFNLNIVLFSEAQKHNTCLNRKISIDTEGYIRNCPSMPEHYGNIKDTTLQEAMQHPDFKKYWFINKDQIEVCKDCEFRYICTDCRAYREDPENLLSKPLKCGYNPYTCEWEEWSTNPLKQKAIDYYGMREMVSKE